MLAMYTFILHYTTFSADTEPQAGWNRVFSMCHCRCCSYYMLIVVCGQILDGDVPSFISDKAICIRERRSHQRPQKPILFRSRSVWTIIWINILREETVASPNVSYMVDVERRQKASSRVECLFEIDSASKSTILSATSHMFSVYFSSVACQSSRV